MKKIVVDRSDPFGSPFVPKEKVTYIIDNNRLIKKEEVNGHQRYKDGVYVIGSIRRSSQGGGISYLPETFTIEFKIGYCLVTFSNQGPHINVEEIINSIDDTVQ